MLMLDAAFPPPPDQLLQDLDQVGAQACAVYVWGGASRGWTRAHVAALRARGKYVLPIVVPGNLPPADTSVILAALHSFGFPGGTVATDLEPESEPSASWTFSWDVAQHEAGYRAVDYGTRSELGRYPAADGQWLASWLRTGVMEPVPVLPPGTDAWQFVDDVQLAHGTYDVSLVDPTLFAAPPAAAAAGEGIMLRIPGPSPDSFHLFGVAAGVLMRASSVAGGLGNLEHWLGQPGNGWVNHGRPPGRSLLPGTLTGGRGVDGAGAPRIEVHAVAEDMSVWTLGLADDGSVTLGWEPLPAPTFDVARGPAGAAGLPGPDVRPQVAAALGAIATATTAAASALEAQVGPQG